MYRNRLERKLGLERRRQPGIVYPSHQQQSNILLARFDLNNSSSRSDIRNGLSRLGGIFDRILELQMHDAPEKGELSYAFLSSYSFSATIGFGRGFFDRLGVEKSKIPSKLYAMPSNRDLNDSVPYSINQTDLILQLASANDFINRWVFYYSHLVPDYFLGYQNCSRTKTKPKPCETPIPDVVTTLKDWAILRDIHTGFQRLDGRNLMGFYDGLSNPRGHDLEDTIWINESDEDSQFKDGTYMVFQKIEHDLEAWRMTRTEEQERLIGRSKATGLFLGTLEKADDDKLAIELHSKNRFLRAEAKRRLSKFMNLQRDPKYEIYDNPSFGEINQETLQTSHVRLSNPRVHNGNSKHRIFRRGYLYSDVGQAGNLNSGLLFISFQKDIKMAFEEIKKKLGSSSDGMSSSNSGRTNKGEHGIVQNKHTGTTNGDYHDTGQRDPRFANKFEDEVKPEGNTVTDLGHLASITLGGGYYFIPPIPHRHVENIGNQFF